MNNFDGIVLEYNYIAVDCFIGEALKCSKFFLSHCHTDHMKGLQSNLFHEKLKQCAEAKLYCSKVTKDLVVGDERYMHLEHHMVALDTKNPLTLIRQHQADSESVTVTLLPAGHCPGSVMFLFEGQHGTVLYTGDFRLLRADLEKMEPLFINGRIKTIDNVYVDTTFCTKDALTFPLRSQSFNALCDLLRPWLSKSTNHVVYLECSAHFGCEYLFVELSRHFHMKVHISKNKLWKYRAVPEILESVTVKGEETRLHACFFKVSNRADQNVACQEEDCDSVKHLSYTLPCDRSSSQHGRYEVLVVRLSAMWFVSKTCSSTVVHPISPCKYRVFFSMHSSLSEISDFIHFLHPKSIHPLVVPQNCTLEDVYGLLKLESLSNEISDVSNMSEFGTLKNESLASLEYGSYVDGDSAVLHCKLKNQSPTFDVSSSQELINSEKCDAAGEHVDKSPQWTFDVSPFKEQVSSQESDTSEISLKSDYAITSSEAVAFKNNGTVNSSLSTLNEKASYNTHSIRYLTPQKRQKLHHDPVVSDSRPPVILSPESNQICNDNRGAVNAMEYKTGSGKMKIKCHLDELLSEAPQKTNVTARDTSQDLISSYIAVDLTERAEADTDECDSTPDLDIIVE